MLHRIKMNVVDVAREIRFITDGMLPYRRCHIPFSRLSRLLSERGAASSPREKPAFMELHRRAKSASPCGNFQIACR
jgi:hypothetical protein